MVDDIKILAFYLAQYHPIPENDQWWGTGFTEWTNVTKAQPLFKGHYQPILPADLGFYDLRVPEVREQQADLAKKYGVDGFIYYHYWFGDGKVLLERPLKEVVASKKPDFPFCVCWANQTWKGIWHGLDNPDVLVEQKYPGDDDFRAHFNYLLPMFRDQRYLKVHGKPMFHIYAPESIPDLKHFTAFFNQLAIENGFPGIYFVSVHFPTDSVEMKNMGIDAQIGMDSFIHMRYKSPYIFENGSILNRIERRVLMMLKISNEFGKRQKPRIFDYNKALDNLRRPYPEDITYFPCIIPNWDNSARSGKKSLIFKNATPKRWGKFVEETIEKVKKQPQEDKFIIIKSWNEWAEGNYLEPDRKWGHGWLIELKNAIDKFKK